MKTTIALCVILGVSAVSCQPGPPAWVMAGDVNPWIPPWVAATAAAPAQPAPVQPANPWVVSWLATNPWIPKWKPCTTVGATCSSCTSKQVCTKMLYGIEKACSDPTLPYCVLGECSATPSEECAPPTTTPTAA